MFLTFLSFTNVKHIEIEIVLLNGGNPIYFNVPRGTFGVLSANHFAGTENRFGIGRRRLHRQLVFIITITDDKNATRYQRTDA